MDVSPGRMTVVTGAGAPFGRKVVRSGVALEVPSSKIQFSSVLLTYFQTSRDSPARVRMGVHASYSSSADSTTHGRRVLLQVQAAG